MSYILNALRKSEQERQAQQAETIAGRILANQPPTRHKTSKIVIILIITNLIVLAGFFWFIRKQPDSAPAAAINKSVAPELTPAQPSPALAVPNRMAEKTRLSVNTAPVPTAKSKTLRAKTAPAIQPPLAKPTPVTNNQSKSVQSPAKSVSQIPEPATVLQSPIAPTETAAPNNTDSASAAEPASIPFIFELPADFRHSVPELKINVFVYSNQASEHFVMIDMVKYRVGDLIKESVLLKEIRSDSLVVEYNHRTFRIKRP
jgi:general secretion pathway protein B